MELWSLIAVTPYNHIRPLSDKGTGGRLAPLLQLSISNRIYNTYHVFPPYTLDYQKKNYRTIITKQ